LPSATAKNVCGANNSKSRNFGEAVDEPQRERIQDDLKGLIKGELLFDELSRGLYSTDASIFEVRPLGVATPRDEEDVQAIVRYAAENQIALIPRGAGTGVAGESLGSGLIVDLSRHFRSILEVGEETVRVQPGVVYRDLTERLARQGRRFAPDPTSGVQCTIGGMLATNASGAHALRYGYTRDHVAKLRAVFNNGDAELVGREPRQPDSAPSSGRCREIITNVSALLEGNAEVVRACQPRTRYNRCGYLLDGVLSAHHLDLARLLVGSEGTLAFFTEATLRTIPLPGGRSLVLLGFDSLEFAVRAVGEALPSGPSACELIDRRLLTLARTRNTDVKALLPAEAEAVLLVEYQAETQTEAQDSASRLADLLHRTSRLAV
jgi:FAD/FMN-containing dehydrogenase